MKPSAFTMKALLVIGLGGYALASPSSGAAQRSCIFTVNECPLDPVWLCNYYWCHISNPYCYFDDMVGAWKVSCEGGDT